MTLFYISIPLMLIGVALAVTPLLWTMARHQHANQTPTPIRTDDERVVPDQGTAPLAA